MRTIFLVMLLLPVVAVAAEWVELGNTAEARILLDKQTIEHSGNEARAWLKFLYREKQPGQTVTHGKPFDSSVNQYYVVCSTKKYQVLELVMLYKNETVGLFHGHFDANNLDPAKPNTGVMFLLNRICPVSVPAAAPMKQ